MTIAKAFPDFDVATLPAIPAGFEDASWKNDACPSFINKKLGLRLWIDYADTNLREHEGGYRFILQPDDNDDTISEVITTDDFTVIEEAIMEEHAMVNGCLADLAKHDGAATEDQLDNPAFRVLHKRGLVAMDGDLYIHPKANKIQSVAYTMKDKA